MRTRNAKRELNCLHVLSSKATQTQTASCWVMWSSLCISIDEIERTSNPWELIFLLKGFLCVPRNKQIQLLTTTPEMTLNSYGFWMLWQNVPYCISELKTPQLLLYPSLALVLYLIWDVLCQALVFPSYQSSWNHKDEEGTRLRFCVLFTPILLMPNFITFMVFEHSSVCKESDGSSNDWLYDGLIDSKGMLFGGQIGVLSNIVFIVAGSWTWYCISKVIN